MFDTFSNVWMYIEQQTTAGLDGVFVWCETCPGLFCNKILEVTNKTGTKCLFFPPTPKAPAAWILWLERGTFSSLVQLFWWCLSVCSHSLHPPHLHQLLCEWMSVSFPFCGCTAASTQSPHSSSVFIPPPTQPLCCATPSPPSPGLPPHLSLGGVWGDGSGFCRWWLHGVYRLTASHAQRSARSRCLILGIPEQDTDVSCCV